MPVTFEGYELVDGWAQLPPDAARAWAAFCDYVVGRGYKRPTIEAPSGASRLYSTQVELKTYWAALGLPHYAATPGTGDHYYGRAVDLHDPEDFPRSVLLEAARATGWEFNVSYEPWHMRRNYTIVPAGHDYAEIKGDELSAAEVAQITELIKQVDTNAHNRHAQLIEVLKESNRKTTRAQLYFDSGPTGREFTADTATRCVAAVVTTGFVYPLNPDPAKRAGQMKSLRATPYMLIDARTDFYGLPTQQFENMLGMAAKIRQAIAAEISPTLAPATPS